jgi:hypothetical protein
MTHRGGHGKVLMTLAEAHSRYLHQLRMREVQSLGVQCLVTTQLELLEQPAAVVLASLGIACRQNSAKFRISTSPSGMLLDRKLTAADVCCWAYGAWGCVKSVGVWYPFEGGLGGPPYAGPPEPP